MEKTGLSNNVGRAFYFFSAPAGRIKEFLLRQELPFNAFPILYT